MFIEVPILCNTEQSSDLKDLGIDLSDDNFEQRIGCINVANIVGFYPTANYTETLVAYNATDITVCLSYEEFKKLILSCK